MVAPDFEAAVRRVLGTFGPGEVTSYGEVAAEAGFPGAARAVGGLLARGGEDLCWWRVVNCRGRLVPGHEHEQGRRLAAEGVAVLDGRVAAPATLRRGLVRAGAARRSAT